MEKLYKKSLTVENFCHNQQLEKKQHLIGHIESKFNSYRDTSINIYSNPQIILIQIFSIRIFQVIL